jgi:hypothetical protein
VATAVLVLLQLPPGLPLLVNTAVESSHNGVVPLTVPAFPFGLTVKDFNAVALHPTVYIIFIVPFDTAETNPVAGLTVATAVLLLLQLPPASPEVVKVAVDPIHNGEVPLTVPAFAFGLTFNIVVAVSGLLQPVETIYLIVVVPAPIAVTTPDDAFTVATAVFVLLQVPPASPLLLYVAVAPIHSGDVPLIVPAVASGRKVMEVLLNGLPDTEHPLLAEMEVRLKVVLAAK